MEWKAKWIWDDSGENPRNYWVCFRYSFKLSEKIDKAVMNITADSRYTLYINGRRMGLGPARSWPSEMLYDSYSIEDYLFEGINVIAVLVTHYGISTCQYIEGRGGLIAQLELYKNGRLINQICTDKTWKTMPHHGYNRAAVRISDNLPWTEIYDADKADPDWFKPDYCCSRWGNAIELGEYGIQPWSRLVKRDIPFLTDEPVYPKRVVSSREVLPVRQHISVDCRPNFFPGEYDINDPKLVLGYLAAIIRSPVEMEGYIILTFDEHGTFYGDFKINNHIYNMQNGSMVAVKLKQGDNLMLINMSGGHHDPSIHIAFKFPFDVELKAPLFSEEHKFITIGPFDKKTIIRIGYPVDCSLIESDMYKEVWNINHQDHLKRFSQWILPVLPVHTCVDNVTVISWFKDVLENRVVRTEDHYMVMANDMYTTVEPLQSGDVEYIIDFGREITGFVEFDIHAPSGATLDFFMFESMHDGIIEHTFTLNNTLRYVARQGRQRYRSFIRRGFRYMMLTVRNHKEPVKVYWVRACESTFPVAEIGSFSCSDYLLNRIWEISRDTTRLCMEDTFVDCPAYEQTFWVGDSRNSALICYYTFGAYDLVRHSLNLVSKSLERSPLPESQVPSGWQNVLTAWALCWVMACREYYEFTGDLEFLKGIYPFLKQTGENSQQFINDKGLLEISAWNMLDWAPMDTPYDGVVTHQNALLVRALRDTAYIADILGMGDDSEKFLRMAYRIKDSINKYLWCEEKKGYIDCIHTDGRKSDVLSHQTNIMVYLCDCAEDDRKDAIETLIIHPPENAVKIASPFVSFFYFEALLKLGIMDKVLDSIREIWGNMLDNDATTCWEGWKLVEGHYTRSHCHAWSSAPAYFLGSEVLGVKPMKPGFDKICIKPALGDLKWAKGSIPVPNGRIDVSYRYSDEYFEMDVSVPCKGITHITFPDTQGKKIKLNGKIIEENSIVI